MTDPSVVGEGKRSIKMTSRLVPINWKDKVAIRPDVKAIEGAGLAGGWGVGVGSSTPTVWSLRRPLDTQGKTLELFFSNFKYQVLPRTVLCGQGIRRHCPISEPRLSLEQAQQ